MNQLVKAIEQYISSGKAGDPNGKFTLNQLREIAEILGPKIGDTLTVIVTGTVIDTSDSHGKSYKIALDTKDFYDDNRVIWLDESEINRSL